MLNPLDLNALAASVSQSASAQMREFPLIWLSQILRLSILHLKISVVPGSSTVPASRFPSLYIPRMFMPDCGLSDHASLFMERTSKVSTTSCRPPVLYATPSTPRVVKPWPKSFGFLVSPTL